MNNCLNGIFLLFNTLNSEIFSRNRLTDTFPNYFLFHNINCKDKKSRNSYFCEINKIVFEVLSNANSVIVVLDASIKNNIVTSITHVYFYSNFIKKILYYTINITMTEAELFVIRYRISLAT